MGWAWLRWTTGTKALVCGVCVVLVFYSITHLATAVSRYPFAAHAAASSYP